MNISVIPYNSQVTRPDNPYLLYWLDANVFMELWKNEKKGYYVSLEDYVAKCKKLENPAYPSLNWLGENDNYGIYFLCGRGFIEQKNNEYYLSINNGTNRSLWLISQGYEYIPFALSGFNIEDFPELKNVVLDKNNKVLDSRNWHDIKHVIRLEGRGAFNNKVDHTGNPYSSTWDREKHFEWTDGWLLEYNQNKELFNMKLGTFV